jgi:hypothetical protein
LVSRIILTSLKITFSPSLTGLMFFFHIWGPSPPDLCFLECRVSSTVVLLRGFTFGLVLPLESELESGPWDESVIELLGFSSVDFFGFSGIGLKGRGRGWRGILGSWQIQISSSSQQLVWCLVWCEDSLQL